MRERLTEALQRHFGHPSFRPGQAEVIERVMRGRSVLGLLATGGGKSVTYQLPAMLLPGITVVVSPLISLMVDQVQQLRAKRKIPAAYVNSALDPEETRQVLREIAGGCYKLLYVSPEKLQQTSVQQMLVRCGVSLLAVDEAHCISQWGHDFRTDYLRLPEIAEKLGKPPVLAVTATATPAVRDEICRLFAIDAEDVVAQPLDRSNIALDVIPVDSEAVRREQVLAAIDSLQGPGIVYCSTRQAVDNLVAQYQLSGRKNVHGYHGGMSGMERMLIQEQFLRDELDVIVATNAFGMGIDKANIRYVLHYHFPSSLEAYAQEIGRVGRDGKPGYAALYYLQEDIHIHTHMLEKEYPSAEEIQRFVHLLAGKTELAAGMLEAAQIGAEMGQLLLFYAEQAGLVSEVAATREGFRFSFRTVREGDLTPFASRIREETNRAKRQKRQKLYDMLRWLDSRDCLRVSLNSYFGEAHGPQSGDACCSRCGLKRGAFEQSTHVVSATNEKHWDLRQALEKLLPKRVGRRESEV
jgi:ATP-dependent DNA helicase RecQ